MSRSPLVGTVFPEIYTPFGWPTVAEVHVIHQTWLQVALGTMGWTVHDLINSRWKKDLLMSTWMVWRDIQRQGDKQAAKEWEKYLMYLKTMGLQLEK